MAVLSDLIYRAQALFRLAWFGVKFYESRHVIKKTDGAKQNIQMYLRMIRNVKEKLRELEMSGSSYIIEGSRIELESMYRQLGDIKTKCIYLGIWEILEKTI